MPLGRRFVEFVSRLDAGECLVELGHIGGGPVGPELSRRMWVSEDLGSQGFILLRLPPHLCEAQEEPLISGEVADLLRLGLLWELVCMISHGDACEVGDVLIKGDVAVNV